MRNLILGALALAVISVSATQAHAAQYIVNGGFETGNFAGWTLSGNTGFTSVDGSNPHSGSFSADLGPVGSNGFMSQTFSDVAGQTLNVSFWMQNNGGTPNDFNASFDGTTLLSLTNFAAQPYTLYSYSVVATGLDTLTIGGYRQDPSFFHVDDVSVTSAATPEPSSIALLGTGILGVAGTLRRRMRA